MTRKFAKTARIRQLLAEGKTTAEILALTKCKPQQIYSVRYYDRRKSIPTQPTLWQQIKNFFRSIE